MNKTVFSALAVCTVGSLGHASETEDWLGLDKELESLRTTIATSQNASGVGFSGFFRSSYVWGDESDISGLSIDNVRLDWMGRVYEFDIVFQYEASSAPQGGAPGTSNPQIPVGPGSNSIGTGSSEGVLDAYGAWNFDDDFKLTFGQFRPAVLHSSLMDENELFFYNRTINGFVWAERDQGIQLSGNFDRLGWWAGIQNGDDGGRDDYAYYGRVQFDVVGDGPGNVEGAMGAYEDLELTVGGSLYNDDSLNDGFVWALDAQSTVSNFSFAGELVGYDEDYSPSGDEDALSWDLQGTFMFVPDKWEVGLRYENMDDLFDDDVWILTGAVAYYIEGQDAKVQSSYSHIDSDSSSLEDTDSFQVGITLAW